SPSPASPAASASHFHTSRRRVPENMSASLERAGSRVQGELTTCPAPGGTGLFHLFHLGLRRILLDLLDHLRALGLGLVARAGDREQRPLTILEAETELVALVLVHLEHRSLILVLVLVLVLLGLGGRPRGQQRDRQGQRHHHHANDLPHACTPLPVTG